MQEINLTKYGEIRAILNPNYGCSNDQYHSSTADINKSKPAKINAWAFARVDWTINVKDASGKIVDSFKVENEHSLKTQWIPNTDLQNGTYSISVDVVTKDGFKVTTKPKQVTVLQQ